MALVVRGPGDVPMVPLAKFAGELVAALAPTLPLLLGGHVDFRARDGLRLPRESRSILPGRLLHGLMMNSNVMSLGFLIGSGAALNVSLNFPLIPRYGIAGAAVASLTRRGLDRDFRHPCGRRRKVRPLAVALVMIAVLQGAGFDEILVPGSLAGTCLYLPTAYFFGALPLGISILGFGLSAAQALTPPCPELRQFLPPRELPSGAARAAAADSRRGPPI